MVKRRPTHSMRRKRNMAQRQRRILYFAKIKKHKRRTHRVGAKLHEKLKKRSENFKLNNERTSQRCPLVTFIQKPADSEQKPLHKLEAFQFCLEDGRVDVPQVLQHLGVSKLQYEPYPGVWRALTGLKSGKSINKFQNNQEVFFRIGPSLFHPRAMQKWVDSWYVEGDTEEAYNNRVSRIVQKTAKGRMGVGTMVRVESPLIPGLMLTCRHCVEFSESGTINERLLAFGGPVTVLYVSDKYDLAICKGPPGSNGFRLAEPIEEQISREVRMLSFPWHVDLVYGLREDVGPTQVHGHVCMFSPDGCEMPMEVDALGTYMGGFPASSGGAVTLSSKVLCGIHVGVIWHDKDEPSMPLVLGSLGTFGSQQASISQRPMFHMELCARRSREFSPNEDVPLVSSPTNATTSRSHSEVNFCSSSHGYLATYVSSAHIEEAIQDYFESTKVASNNTRKQRAKNLKIS